MKPVLRSQFSFNSNTIAVKRNITYRFINRFFFITLLSPLYSYLLNILYKDQQGNQTINMSVRLSSNAQVLSFYRMINIEVFYEIILNMY